MLTPASAEDSPRQLRPHADAHAHAIGLHGIELVCPTNYMSPVPSDAVQIWSGSTSTVRAKWQGVALNSEIDEASANAARCLSAWNDRIVSARTELRPSSESFAGPLPPLANKNIVVFVN